MLLSSDQASAFNSLHIFGGTRGLASGVIYGGRSRACGARAEVGGASSAAAGLGMAIR